MSNLDNILKKISDDANTRTNQILQQAREDSTKKSEEILNEVNVKKEEILNEAKLSASRLKEQVVVGKNLEIRNNKLEAKQKIIDKVFEQSCQKLNDMPEKDFLKFVKTYCANINIKENDEIILPDKYNKINISQISPNLKLYVGDRKINGGFILISGGIEQNNTFEALIDYYRHDLEQDVIRKLF